MASGRLAGSGCALFFEADFLVERVPQLVRGALELAEALAERAAELRQLRGPKMISAIMKMMISSGIPMEPNIRQILGKAEVVRTLSDYRNRARPGQASPAGLLPGSRCDVRHLVCYDPIMRHSRFVPVAVLAIVVSALVGGLFGSSVAGPAGRGHAAVSRLHAALAAIDREYVDEVPSDRLVYSAIDGMLQTLDPHSSFFDPKSYAQMRERQEGRYYGLGIPIQVIDGDITVMSIFEGSPAYKKGLRRGDVIARIAGDDAKGWTSEQAVSKLRGRRARPSTSRIRRRGYDELIDLDVERDEVNISTVRGAFMIDKDTGYIKLSDFAETTDDEVGDALQEADRRRA